MTTLVLLILTVYLATSFNRLNDLRMAVVLFLQSLEQEHRRVILFLVMWSGCALFVMLRCALFPSHTVWRRRAASEPEASNACVTIFSICYIAPTPKSTSLQAASKGSNLPAFLITMECSALAGMTLCRSGLDAKDDLLDFIDG